MRDNEKLYAVIATSLNMMIEDHDCGDIDLEQFTNKVERMFGDTPISHVSPKMGIEWSVSGDVSTLYYAATGYRVALNIRNKDGNKFVHGNITHEDLDDVEGDEGDNNEDDAEAAASVDEEEEEVGCGDPSCENCNPAEYVRNSLQGASMIPLIRTILSFGPLKRDEN